MGTGYSREQLCRLDRGQLEALCAELREKIIASAQENGGHLASNLGTVELTVALHRCFDPPNDRLFFDVGHQCYAHKLLDGREAGFASLRRQGGVSGMSCREESPSDPMTGGHSGSALSAALGAAEAERIRGGKKYAVAVIGDGSFTNGMIYEALNNCVGELRRDLRLVIVLNDNGMSISRNVGGLSRYFSRIRNSEKYFSFKTFLKKLFSRLPLIGGGLTDAAGWIKEHIKRLFLASNIFEDLGLEYLGPVPGHDIAKLESVFKEAKKRKGCVLVHVNTVKGKGFRAAEDEPSKYHSIPPRTPKVHPIARSGESFSERMGSVLSRIAAADGSVCAVTAAMGLGTGLGQFAEKYPERFFDVGIAEEHAVTFSGGLALGGMKPVCAVYSTFLQRTFDQLWHDLSLQRLPAVIAVDRAGLVPYDGPAHQGLSDIALLGAIPGVTVLCPDTLSELEEMLCAALADPGDRSENGGVTVIRYPRGGECLFDRSVFVGGDDTEHADFGEKKNGGYTAVITYGRLTASVCAAAERADASCPVRVIRLKKVLPLPEDELRTLTAGAERIVFFEEGILTGGVGQRTAAALGRPVRIIASPDGFADHADLLDLDSRCGFLPAQIEKILTASVPLGETAETTEQKNKTR